MKKIIKKLISKNHKKGFTLIEMLIVLVVVGLLMAIIIPNVSGQRKRINQQAAENIAEILTTQYNTYVIAEGQTDSVTLAELETKGYITSKQKEQAIKLLNIDEKSKIEPPITVPEVK